MRILSLNWDQKGLINNVRKVNAKRITIDLIDTPVQSLERIVRKVQNLYDSEQDTREPFAQDQTTYLAWGRTHLTLLNILNRKVRNKIGEYILQEKLIPTGLTVQTPREIIQMKLVFPQHLPQALVSLETGSPVTRLAEETSGVKQTYYEFYRKMTPPNAHQPVEERRKIPFAAVARKRKRADELQRIIQEFMDQDDREILDDPHLNQLLNEVDIPTQPPTPNPNPTTSGAASSSGELTSTQSTQTPLTPEQTTSQPPTKNSTEPFTRITSFRLPTTTESDKQPRSFIHGQTTLIKFSQPLPLSKLSETFGGFSFTYLGTDDSGDGVYAVVS